MKALVLNETGRFPDLEERADPRCKEGLSMVEIKAAGLNRRDYYLCKGLYPRIELPVVPGSDGAGISDGKEVIIQPGKGWDKKSEVQPSDYTILGMPRDGTLMQKLCIEPNRLFPKPAHLTFSQAAALGLGGLTAFRALFTKGGCRKNSKVLITGAGGGVASLALQMAVAAGASVYVTSGEQWKLDKSADLGAVGGVNYKSEDWYKLLLEESGLFDLIIDSAGGPDFKHLVKLCAPGGRIVIYGGTVGKISGISPQLIFWRQISILGTTMGSSEEFGEMLRFVNENRIVPVVHRVYPIDKSGEAFAALENSKIFGKVVISLEE